MDALQQLNLAAPIADTYSSLEHAIICHIAEQLAANPDTLINATSEWRIKMLAQMGRLNKDTAKIIAAKTSKVPSEVEAVVNKAIDGVLTEYGLSMTDKISDSVSAALKNYDMQAVKSKYNQVNTVMQYKAKRLYADSVNQVASVFDRIQQKTLANSQEFLDVLNKNALATVVGEKSRTEALRETVSQMCDKGIPAFVDASGKEWSPEAYVNMDIRNTAKNSALAAQWTAMDELDQDVILVSSHSGARPLCAKFQGKLYSRSGKSGTIKDARGKEYKYEPLSSTSFGKPAGLFGINCGHRMRGVSDGTFINREKQYDEKENSEEYEKVCEQRKQERKIRNDKNKRDALKAAGDNEGAKAVNTKIAKENKELKAYCDSNGLSYRKDRTDVYGYSNPADKVQNEDFVETVNKNLDNPKKSGIIEEKKPDWDNGLEPHGQLDVKFVDDDGDDLYSFVADELQVSKEKAIEYADSVMGFTDSLYSDIRSFQRGEIADEEIKKVSENIEGYIKKAPRWNGGTTYRGSTISDEELASYKQGYSLRMGGTASWSDKEDVAIDFATRNTSGERPNEVIYHCETQSKGTAIRHLSVFENESEVLCSKKSEYIVDKVEGGYGRYHIYLKEGE